MQESRKRSLSAQGLDSSLSQKRVRHNPQPMSSSIHPKGSSPSIPPSSPTLIGSAPTTSPSPSLESTETEEIDSLTSSHTSTSESSETSVRIPPSSPSFFSNDTSIVDRAVLSMVPPEILQQDLESLEALNTETSSESETSTSSSSEDESTSSESESESEENENSGASSSPLESPSNPSPTPKPPTGPLTSKNLTKLQQRLDSLLPKIKTANEQLDQDRAAGKLEQRNIENIDDHEESGRGYIEMNLGLGVLEDRNNGKDDDETENSSSSSEESKLKKGAGKSSKEDAVARLLHPPKRKRKAKVKIEEVGGD